MNTLTAETIQRLVVLLIQPSNWDDAGYLVEFRKAVIPTASTSTLYAITKAALQLPGLDHLSHVVKTFHEAVYNQRVEPEKLMRQFGGQGTKVVVGLVGVQTNQFLRAADLARQFKALGAEVVIGGFHVSGSLATMTGGGISAADQSRPNIPCPERMPFEIQELMDEGIIMFSGEAENGWHQVLVDIVNGEPKILYHGGLANLSEQAMPDFPDYFLEGFAGKLRVVQCCRGCPLACDFCSIINAQGRTMRSYSTEAIVAWARRLCAQRQHVWFFITDDNFARNRNWEKILDGFIAIQQELKGTGKTFNFMCEVDLAAYKIPRFFEKLGLAGCRTVFLGVESLNQETLDSAHKGQNRTDRYQEIFAALHSNGIMVHAAIIIGFPSDTPESVAQEVKQLKGLGVDQASFFILTLIPGSEIHVRAVASGVEMDADLNRYDSFRAVSDHQTMSRQELEQTYYDAWKNFYRSAHLIEVLKRCKDDSTYWWMFKNFLWSRNSTRCEGRHPMACGFWRIRSRVRGKRPGTKIDNVFVHFLKYVGWRVKYISLVIAEFFIWQHVYFQSKLKGQIEHRVSGDLRGAFDWLLRTFHLPASRVWLNRLWVRYGKQKWHLFWKLHWHAILVPCSLTEIIFLIRFAPPFLRGFREMV